MGSSYRLSYQPVENGSVVPTITGRAFVTKEAQRIFHDKDALRTGIVLNND
jgi:4-hydroxyproline epimerase